MILVAMTSRFFFSPKIGKNAANPAFFVHPVYNYDNIIYILYGVSDVYAD